MSVRIAVFASGGGTNFQSLIDRFRDVSHASVALLLTDRADAGAIERAREAGVDAVHVGMRQRSPEAVESDLHHALQAHGIDFIALAGFLRLVPASIAAAYHGRIVNIHPALLPAFGGTGMYGRRVHQAVLDAGCTVSGATVHHVDERYDEGRIIAQWPVPVFRDDTADSLAARVLSIEHRLYPAVVVALTKRLADGRPTMLTPHAGAIASTAQQGVFRLMKSMDDADAEITAVAGL